MMSPKKPDQLDAYIRVSRVGARDVESDSYITEKVQREQIERWAELRGVKIAKVHLDRDQSGGKLERPGLDAMMARVRAGETGGVVVAKLDRLSRAGVGDALKLVGEIHDSGGVLAAIDLGVDPTTDTGELLLTLMLALARMERRRLAAGWEVAKSRAIGRGVKVSRAALGYRALEEGTLELDPDTAPAVAEAFRRAAGGDQLGAIAEWLHGLDLRNPHRHPKTGKTGEPYTWTATTVRRLLGRTDYRGELTWNGQTVECPAIVDRATWTLAQPTEPKGRMAPAAFPLSGVATCAGCGSHLVGATMGEGQKGYRCAASVGRRRQEQGAKCPAPASIMADRLDVYVKGAAIVLMQAEAEYRVGGKTSDELVRREGEARAAAVELEAFAGDLEARQLLGEAAWRKALETRVRAREDSDAAFREALEAERPQRRILPSMALLSGDTDPADLSAVYRAMFERIEVQRGRGRDLRERVKIVARDRQRGAVLTEYLRRRYPGEVVKAG
jgi:DNA invertase Pin-like site-specific DNA recombinase